MMMYINVHLTYILPIISILTFICWPFINRNELFKIVLISTISFIYTLPLNNYFVYNELKTFPTGTVMGFIGHVPIEDYMYSIIQTVLTLLWTLLCVRWTIPCLNFNCDKQSYLLIRWIPILLLSIVAAIGYTLMVPAQHTFYLGCIMFGLSPMIIFIWYGAGNYFVKNIIPSSIAIIVPTLYQCWVNKICLRNNVWYVSEVTSLNIIIDEHLPLEDALFYFITNFHLVLLASYYDKARGMIDTFMMEFPHRFNMSSAYIGQFFKALITSEYKMDPNVIEDIKACSELTFKSKAFSTSILFCSPNFRLIFMIICSFARVTDDMFDDKGNKENLIYKMELIKQFINDLFANRKSDYEIKTKPCDVIIDWEKYESKLTRLELSCFRAISRISFYLPRKPFYELLAGYQWDVEGRLIRDEDDLMLYSDYVSGTIVQLCISLYLYIHDNYNSSLILDNMSAMVKMQQLGRVIQIFNIACDIINDSEELGRCYIPIEYMDEKEVEILCTEKKPRSLGNKKLKKYSKRLIHLARRKYLDSFKFFKYFPKDIRYFISVLYEYSLGLSSVLLSSPTYPSNASLSKWNKICIAFNCFYMNK